MKKLTFTVLTGMIASSLFAAVISEATHLSVGKMAVEPVIDNTITVEEEGAANVQYGALSPETGLMATRYAVFHIGFCEKGVYFATRTSIPKLPQTLNAEDVVELTLQPAAASSRPPYRYAFKLAERARMLKGIRDFGVKCCEFETIIPFEGCGKMPHLRRGACGGQGTARPTGDGDQSVGRGLRSPPDSLPRPKPGEKWGFNMSVTFSSEKETAYFHLPSAKGHESGDAGSDTGELATLAYEPDLPSFSLVNFGELEEWRASGNLGAAFRFSAPEKACRIDSKSYLIHRMSYSKLDSDPENDPEMKSLHEKVTELQNLTLAAGEGREIFYRVWVLWGGTVNVLNLDLATGGRTICRRLVKWDTAKGLKWKDAEGLPSFEMGFYPSITNRLRLAIQANGIRDLTGGDVCVVGSKGNLVWRKPLAGTPKFARERIDTVLGKLPYDDYTVRLTLTNAAGRAYRHERTFAVRHFAWQDAHIGEERVVVPPFRPIRVEKGEISFLQTGYGCKGLFWDAVYAKGENILAAPITLTLNGQEFAVTGAEYKEISDDRVIREVKAEIPLSTSTSSLHLSSTSTSSLHLTVTQTYDYDGFCWTKLAFDAKEPVEVRELKLVVPYQAKYLKYFQTIHRTNVRNGPAPDFSLPQTNGVVWHPTVGWNYKSVWYGNEFPAPMQPYVWFGGYQKGMGWLMESFKGTSLEKDREPQRLVRDGDIATYEIELVNKPTVWKGSNEIQMGFQPTPVKPMDPNCYKLATLMYNYACPSNAVFLRGTGDREFYYHANTMEVQTYPGDDASFMQWTFAQRKRDTKLYRAKLKEYCDKHADWFRAHRRSPMAYYGGNQNSDRDMGVDENYCYFDPKQISSFWPEWEMYKSEWFPMDWCEDDYFNEYMGTDPKTRVDKLMWDCRTALRHGFGGVFFDCYANTPTRGIAEGDAYVKPDGSIQISTGEVRGWRSIMKRSATLCHLMGKNLYGRPHVSNHDTNGSVAPVMSFCATAGSTERGSRGGEFPIRFCESFMLVDVVGGQSGRYTRITVSAKQGDRARQEREMRSLIALMFAYGYFSISDQGLAPNCPWFDQALNLPFDYGWGKPEIVTHHTFWDELPQPVTHTGNKVRVSVAEKKGKEALLMFGSLGTEPEDVTFDVSGLNLGAVKYTDALTGEPLAEPKLHFGRFGYRAIRVERK